MMACIVHRWTVAAVALLLFASLAWVFLNLPAPTVGLREPVMTRLTDSGARHPVTAVLLNFRGYDTFLEVGVLLLAALGVLSLHTSKYAPSRTAPAHTVLAALTRALTPLMILTAGYLLWAGARQPGGAFQAGAVLAALGVLLRLSGVLPAFTPPPAWRRFGLVFGFVVFLAAAVSALAHGALLEYPHAAAGVLILAIESALTLSIAFILTTLYSASQIE